MVKEQKQSNKVHSVIFFISPFLSQLNKNSKELASDLNNLHSALQSLYGKWSAPNPKNIVLMGNLKPNDLLFQAEIFKQNFIYLNRKGTKMALLLFKKGLITLNDILYMDQKLFKQCIDYLIQKIQVGIEQFQLMLFMEKNRQAQQIPLYNMQR